MRHLNISAQVDMLFSNQMMLIEVYTETKFQVATFEFHFFSVIALMILK